MTLTSRMSEMVQKALEGVERTDVLHEVSFTIVPGPQGPQPVMLLALAMPSTVIGEWVTGVSVVPNLVPDEEQMRGATMQMLDSLREQKAKVAQEAMSQGNGQQQAPPPSGLVVPGR